MKTLFHYMLALGMLITGSVNTISTKAADKVVTVGRPGSEPHEFSHPFFQAAGMFVGEFLCLLTFRLLICYSKQTDGKRVDTAKPFPRYIFLLPALCDMTATSLMYVGLTLTYASIFQMLRGSVVIFTGILTVVFLRRKLKAFHWLGMFLVLVGTALVGASSMVCHEAGNADAPRNPTLGNILIIIAQVVVAFQVVVEEKFIGGYNIPALQVVGWEGLWGFSVLSCVLLGMYWIPQPPFLEVPGVSTAHFEDSVDAFYMLGNSWKLSLCIAGNVLSIAFFNYFGISVTKHMNAATRMVLDSVRTVVIWAFSMAVGWQDFCWMQVLGFLVLLTGTVVYNALIKIPGLPYEEEPTKEVELDSDDELEEGLMSNDILAGQGRSVNSRGGRMRPEDSPMIPSLDVLSSPAMSKYTSIKQR